MTAKGIAGESKASSISPQFSIIINPAKHVTEAIVILPRTMNTLPIPATRVNFPACLRINRKPFMAERQKLSEVKAIWIYAFLLMYLINLSTQSRQHLQQQIMHLTIALKFPPDYYTLFAINSKIILIAQTTAMMNEPKARDPAWYLKIHQNPDL